MKPTLERFFLAAASLALASCGGMFTHNHEVQKDTAPGYSRYLQDPAAPKTDTANAPAPGSQAPATADTPATPPAGSKTDAAPGAGAAPSTAGTPATPPPPTSQYPYGKPVPGKKGFVTSPYDDKAGMIDVRDYAPGTKVRDPYTNKIFLVP